MILLKRCPRCQGDVDQAQLQEPYCVQCGWVEYGNLYNDHPWAPKPVEEIAWLQGAHPPHNGRITVRYEYEAVKVYENGGSRLAKRRAPSPAPECPYCGLRMALAEGYSSNLDTQTQRRQGTVCECPQRHRIHLWREWGRLWWAA